MSLYVLDTDTLQLYQDDNPKVVSRVRAVAASEKAISVITVEEQLSGWYTQLRQAKGPEKLAWAYRRLAATVRFLARIGIIDFDELAIQRYEILKKSKLKVSKMDLRIAAIVLVSSFFKWSHFCTLTRDSTQRACEHIFATNPLSYS